MPKTEAQKKCNREWMRNNNRKTSLARKTKRGSTWMGRKWEIFAAKLLGAQDMNEDVMNQPGFDLLWGKKRVEVKAAEYLVHQKGYSSRSWTFNTRDPKHSHYYLLICLKQGSPYKLYLVPSRTIPKGGTSLFETTTKYDKFQLKLL